jgi:hypothetical protein
LKSLLRTHPVTKRSPKYGKADQIKIKETKAALTGQFCGWPMVLGFNDRRLTEFVYCNAPAWQKAHRGGYSPLTPFFCPYHAKLKSRKARLAEDVRIRRKLSKLGAHVDSGFGLYPVNEILGFRDQLRKAA